MVLWFWTISVIFLICVYLSHLDCLLNSDFPVEVLVLEKCESLLRQSMADADEGSLWLQHSVNLFEHHKHVIGGIVSTLTKFSMLHRSSPKWLYRAPHRICEDHTSSFSNPLLHLCKSSLLTFELVSLVPALVAHELHGSGIDIHADDSLVSVVVHFLRYSRYACPDVQDQIRLSYRCRKHLFDANPSLIPVEELLHSVLARVNYPLYLVSQYFSSP